MADEPTAPTALVDVAMDSPGARAILHRLGGDHEARNLRTDVSDIVAAVLHSIPRQRVIDLCIPPVDRAQSVTCRSSTSPRAT